MWWDLIRKHLNVGETIYTPGKGMDGGNKRRPFIVQNMTSTALFILSGNSVIKLEKECFDVIETAFLENPNLWLRVASVKSNTPLPDSADLLIRIATGSSLSRGNYVCAILEHVQLVNYSMHNNWKVIVLNRHDDLT